MRAEPLTWGEFHKEKLPPEERRKLVVAISKGLDVPPWLVDTELAVPRWRRLRWRLRRVYPRLVWP
jgi:hypothetical protein